MSNTKSQNTQASHYQLKLTKNEVTRLLTLTPPKQTAEALQALLNQLFIFADDLPFSDRGFEDQRLALVYTIWMYENLERKLNGEELI